MTRRHQNIKDFIKYLDQTLELFDGKVPNKDFEDKNSDVYKLFTTLFKMYQGKNKKRSIVGANGNGALESDSETDQMSESDISTIVAKHLSKKRKQKTEKFSWENQRDIEESDKEVYAIFRQRMEELQTTDDEPILFSDAKPKKTDPELKPIAKISKPQKEIQREIIATKPIKEIDLKPASKAKPIQKVQIRKPIIPETEEIEETETTNGTTDSVAQTINERTEDIDRKISRLKKLLEK